MNIIDILFICSASFLLKEVSGPWGILGRARNFLLNNGPYFTRIFFFGFFSCWYCIGFWAGILKIFFFSHHLTVASILEWGLLGAIVSLIFGGIYEKLYSE